MKNFSFFSLTLLVFALSFTACLEKTALEPEAPITKTVPTIPEGSRIRIHFGTFIQNNCIYSFSDCISIIFDFATLVNREGHYAVSFPADVDVQGIFGSFFPLTSDFSFDPSTAKQLGLSPQVIPAGFYPIVDTPDGKLLIFKQDDNYMTASLVNSKFAQDNIGQLHNLAMQTVLSPANRVIIRHMNDDRKAVEAFLIDETEKFLAEKDLPVSADELKLVKSLNLDRNYADYSAQIESATLLSAGDKKVLLNVFDQAAQIPVATPADLGRFVRLMTEMENNLGTDLDNPRLVQSMISTLKYSRYYWFWKAISFGGDGTAPSSKIPEWVWADVIGLELGGPLASAVASAIVYWDTH